MDFFAGRRSWRQFYGFIERLPYWGHYKTALVMDEAWAARVVDMEMSGLTPPPTGENVLGPQGYSDVIARLDLIADRVMLVRTATQANYTKGHKEPSVDPLPRPTTAIDRERERRARIVLHEADELFMSGGGFVLGGEE